MSADIDPLMDHHASITELHAANHSKLPAGSTDDLYESSVDEFWLDPQISAFWVSFTRRILGLRPNQLTDVVNEVPEDILADGHEGQRMQDAPLVVGDDGTIYKPIAHINDLKDKCLDALIGTDFKALSLLQGLAEGVKDRLLIAASEKNDVSTLIKIGSIDMEEQRRAEASERSADVIPLQPKASPTPTEPQPPRTIFQGH